MSFRTLALDAMTDKGYGNFGNFHKERSRSSSFPYTQKSNPTPEDDTPAPVKRKIKKKMSIPIGKSDFHSDLGTDKFYFVGGNTKLRDCFERPEMVLEKVVSYARMFSPVPKLNRGPKVGGGASFPSGVGSTHGIGMKSGWASAPPEFDESFLEKYEEDDDILDADGYVYKKDAENY